MDRMHVAPPTESISSFEGTWANTNLTVSIENTSDCCFRTDTTLAYSARSHLQHLRS